MLVVQLPQFIHTCKESVHHQFKNWNLEYHMLMLYKGLKRPPEGYLKTLNTSSTCGQ